MQIWCLYSSYIILLHESLDILQYTLVLTCLDERDFAIFRTTTPWPNHMTRALALIHSFNRWRISCQLPGATVPCRGQVATSWCASG